MLPCLLSEDWGTQAHGHVLTLGLWPVGPGISAHRVVPAQPRPLAAHVRPAMLPGAVTLRFPYLLALELGPVGPGGSTHRAAHAGLYAALLHPCDLAN